MLFLTNKLDYITQINNEIIKSFSYCRLVFVPPNFMKFGIRGQLADVITCVKFLVDRFRGYGVLTPPKLPFPCCVALTTVPCDTVMTIT